MAAPDAQKPEGKGGGHPPPVAPKGPETVRGFVTEPFKHAGTRYPHGDAIELAPEVFADFEGRGWVSRKRPLSDGEIRMPEGKPKDVRCTVVSPVKWGGTRHDVGAKLLLPFSDFKRLAEGRAVELLVD